jgi:hypothetical protein
MWIIAWVACAGSNGTWAGESEGTRSSLLSVAIPACPAISRQRRSQTARSPPHADTNANVTASVGSRCPLAALDSTDGANNAVRASSR